MVTAGSPAFVADSGSVGQSLCGLIVSSHQNVAVARYVNVFKMKKGS